MARCWVSARISRWRKRHRCMRRVNYSPACHLTKAPSGVARGMRLKARALVEHAPGIICFLIRVANRRRVSLRDLGEWSDARKGRGPFLEE